MENKTMDHLKMHSMNKIDENVSKIATLFPNCVTEAKNDYGEIIHKIDFDMLKQELSSTLVEGREERYQFTWPDKKQAILTANAPINKTLRPCREESVNFDEAENLYIEGDNLEVLKLLQETYLGKIKMIYIDPPYNTGNDFVYNDDFSQDADDYMSNSGQTDEDGNRLVANTESNGRFHTDWLNMIYPRLKLARDLLTDDGVIFISIDENELENLKKVCDEIFGEKNIVGDIIWDKRNPKGSVAGVAYQHESIIAYAKNLQSFAEKPFTKKKEHATEMIKKVNSLIEKYGLVNNSVRNEYKEYLKTKKGDFSGGELAYSLIDDTGRIYRCVSMAAPDKPETRSHRPLMHPVTKKPCAVPQKGWRYIDKTMDDLLAKGKVEFGQDESTVPNQKYYLDENLEEAFSSMIYFGGTGSDDTVELSFDNPKPLYVMIKIVNSVCKKDSEDIILDFFSGSATTAHAVMQLNAEDSGKRKFIMVQLPEPCDEKSEAFKAGYKNICEIGKERIRRAGKQILELSLENLEKEGVIEKYAGKLSEIRSLEEIYGFSGESLSVGEKTSERGNVCSVGSDEKSGGVDSIEYSGRTSERNQRVHSISENSKGVSCRIGDTTIDLRTLELLNNLGYRIKFESFGGDKQNDLFSDNNSNSKTLSTQLSALKSKLSVLTTLDIGFRVLKCDTSNMEDVYYTPDHIDKQDLFKNNIKSDRTAEDLLFQVMLDLGIMLSSKIQTKQIDGKNVYCVEGNYLMACFDDSVDEKTITKIAKEKPYYFVMKDSSMANDSVATNFEQIFTTYSPETVRKIL